MTDITTDFLTVCQRSLYHVCSFLLFKIALYKLLITLLKTWYRELVSNLLTVFLQKTQWSFFRKPTHVIAHSEKHKQPDFLPQALESWRWKYYAKVFNKYQTLLTLNTLFSLSVISCEEGKALAESWNAAFMESSAKENQVTSHLQHTHFLLALWCVLFSDTVLSGRIQILLKSFKRSLA